MSVASAREGALVAAPAPVQYQVAGSYGQAMAAPMSTLGSAYGAAPTYTTMAAQAPVTQVESQIDQIRARLMGRMQSTTTTQALRAAAAPQVQEAGQTQKPKKSPITQVFILGSNVLSRNRRPAGGNKDRAASDDEEEEVVVAYV